MNLLNLIPHYTNRTQQSDEELNNSAKIEILNYSNSEPEWLVYRQTLPENLYIYKYSA